MNSLDFGMPTLIEQPHLDDSAKLCKSLGLKFIELNMNLPQYQVSSLENLSYYQEIAEKYQIYFTIHLDENFNIADFNPFVSDAYLQTLLRTINVAKALQIPLLNLHMNHGVHFTLPDRKIYLFEQYSNEYQRSFQKLKTVCEEQIGSAPIQVCFENTDGFHEYEKNLLEGLLQSEVLGLTWDIGHSHSCQDVDEYFIMKHKKKLCHFHIHDAIEKRNHLPLGTGDVNLIKRLQLAKDLNCRCVLETKTIDGLIHSVNWITDNLRLLD